MTRNFLIILSLFLFVASGIAACGNESDLSSAGDNNGSRGATGGEAGDGDGDGDGDGGSSGDDTTCPESYAVCSGQCAPLQIDPLNCGACGQTCGDQEACLDGVCRNFGCDTGGVACGDSCVNLQSDRLNCGACDAACSDGQLCVEGSCLASCAEGLLACNNACVNPLSDAVYCGVSSCDADSTVSPSEPVCAADEVCVSGSCRSFLPVWSSGVAISNADNFERNSEMSIDSDAAGNAIAVWREQVTSESSSLRLFARRYDVSTRTWGDQEQISGANGRVKNPKVVMSPSGTAFALWISEAESSVDKYSLKGSRFTADGGWTSEFTVSSQGSTQSIDNPDGVIAASGDVHVFWSQQDSVSLKYRIRTRILSGSSLSLGTESTFDGFDSLVSVDQSDLDSFFPRAAINDSGEIGLMFMQFDEPAATNSEAYFYSAVYNSLTEVWTTQVLLSGATTSQQRPSVAIDGDGVVSTVWAEKDSLNNYQIYLSQFDGVWDATPQLITDPSIIAESVNSFETPTDPVVTSDSSGIVTVAYASGTANTTRDIRAVRIESGESNSHSLLASDQDSAAFFSTMNLMIDSDDAGGAFVLWSTETQNQVVSRFETAEPMNESWSAAEIINDSSLGSSSSAAFTVSPSKRAYVIWLQTLDAQDPSTSIYFSRFD